MHPKSQVTVDMSFHTQLGLDVDWANGRSLYVRHLQAGAVEEWNRQPGAPDVLSPEKSAEKGRGGTPKSETSRKARGKPGKGKWGDSNLGMSLYWANLLRS